MEANPQTVTHVNFYVPPPLSPSSLWSVTVSLSVYSQSLSLSLFVSHWDGRPVGQSVSMSVCHIIIHQLCVIIRASISMSLGHPATTFRGSNMKRQLCRNILLCIWCLKSLLLLSYGSVLSDNVTIVHFQVCWLVAYSSNRFIQRPVLVVHVYSALVVGSRTSSVDVL